ncbi:spore germination protein [Paenibacillus taiwanensis]|uniref:spore germination protein n=1 Tax=Paenibacillus taiwanensis TaxID=401638 RepID=UPI000427458A|nr:spore germination protein [Paenibacillus taiwanensis]
MNITRMMEWDIWGGAIIVFAGPYGMYLLMQWLKQLKRQSALSYNQAANLHNNQHQTLECSTDDTASIHTDTSDERHLLSISSLLHQKIDYIGNQLGHSSDLTVRYLTLSDHSARNSAILFINGLVDEKMISDFIISPVMQNRDSISSILSQQPEQLLSTLHESYIPICKGEMCPSAEYVVSKLLSGSVALLVDGVTETLVMDVKSSNGRNGEEPISEPLVRGPRIGFVESIEDNISILRIRAVDRNLTIQPYELGARNTTKAALVFIRDLANAELVAEVDRRIQTIDIDDLPESGYLEQLIEDDFLSPFPQMQNTERPDRVIAALLEGRIAILLDGTPFVLLAPVTFSMLLQSPEDYYERWLPSTLIRMLRYLAAFIAMFVPAIYISFVSFHHGMIPTKLAVSMAGTREGVPFPPIVEALMMEISIEILREAGLRLPKPVGQTVGLVGGLVIGQAAVEARIVSPIMVIVVALTAITSFAIPQYGAGMPIRILRFVAMFCAATFGLYGVLLFFIMLYTHIVRLHSFGIPYDSPTAPPQAAGFKDWKDFMIRVPLFLLKRRPRMNHPQDSVRQDPNPKPKG